MLALSNSARGSSWTLTSFISGCRLSDSCSTCSESFLCNSSLMPITCSCTIFLYCWATSTLSLILAFTCCANSDSLMVLRAPWAFCDALTK
uniref:Uncharacterized protein n=1 Tax=Anguilla anguilla TaxID=7936 RepID=A0A0E9XYR5_ANGAN